MKRVVSLFLSLAMVFSMVVPVAAAQSEYTDVAQGDWYCEAVERASGLTLMSGYEDGSFRPSGSITLAETITIAARIRAIHEGEESAFEATIPWYKTYADYAAAHGIPVGSEADFNRAVTRLEFARIMAKALPESELKAINKVADGAIPDVASDESVYLLYRAGVLSGSDDKGTFLPENTIARCEVAVIAANLAQPEQRAKFTLGGTEQAEKPSSGKTDREDKDESVKTEGIDEDNALTAPFDLVYPDLFASGEIAYSGEQILIKTKQNITAAQQGQLSEAGVTALEQIMDLESGKWYKAYVDGDVTDVMPEVRKLSFVVVAEYDYAYETDSIIECGPEDLDEIVHGNKQFADQWYLRSCGLKKGWDHVKNPHYRPGYDETPEDEDDNGASDGEVALTGGGNGIVVAVIDTGVDYTHEDLKDNIWVNRNEIPDDGRDNDGNGYVDDYYGWNAVTKKGSAMDDQGHGTHVAGIIAAANNNVGIVGVAYNAKIMPIKAGMASGYFNQSDIAKAILYAYENGADVINMSFGGTANSIAVQDALVTAYTDCILVAAAGNGGVPNEATGSWSPAPSYPAALTYVLGVMSVNQNGVESAFTNWDVGAFNDVEYELYAPGESMISTIPGDRYATWSGTSMAAPVVSAMAAILREEFRDRDTYPTKFIYGQLAATGELNAVCGDPTHGTHNLPQIVDLYKALTVMPTPAVGVKDHTYFDTVGLMGNEKNNGDGIIDAGETIALGFELRNRWGMSKDTVISVNTLSQADIPEPYVTIHNDSAQYGSVGTYSTQDAGKVMDGDVWVGWENPIYITVSEDCPNDYIFRLNYSLECANALDPEDDTVYTDKGGILCEVRRGVLLPNVIREDMTLTADNYYIVPNTTLIQEGVTLTAEAGTQIQIWSDDPNDAYADTAIAGLNVEGTFICNGTADAPVRIFPSELMGEYEVRLSNLTGDGVIKLYHTEVVNMTNYAHYSDDVVITYAENCRFTRNYSNKPLRVRSVSGSNVNTGNTSAQISIRMARDCIFYRLGCYTEWHTIYKDYIKCGEYIGCLFADSCIDFSAGEGYENCVFYGNNVYQGRENGGTSEFLMVAYPSVNFDTTRWYTHPETGTHYMQVNIPSTRTEWQRLAVAFAEHLGGHLARFETEEEMRLVLNNMQNLASILLIDLSRDLSTGEVTWSDGSEVGDFIRYTYNGNGRFGFCNKENGGEWTFNVGEPYNSGVSALLEIPAVYVEDIKLNAYEITLDAEEGSCWQIEATLAPLSAAGAQVIFESTDENVAVVNETGLVTSVGEGSAEIRVWSPDRYLYNTLEVTVTAPVAPESFVLDEDFTLGVGESRLLKPVFTPEESTKPYLIYTSSDDEIASVSATGVVTAHKEGEAVITAEHPAAGLTASVTVNAVVAVSAVVAEDAIYAASLDGEEKADVLGISVLPADATDKTLIWESSNPEIAYVDEVGILQKLKAGNATLRATAKGTDLHAEVTVSISEESSAAAVVQVERVSFGGTSNYYGTFGYVALLDDGTMWYWGEAAPVPEKLPFENVKKFGMGAQMKTRYTTFMILDKNNELNMWSYTLGGNYEPNLSNYALGGISMKNVSDIGTRPLSSNEHYHVLKEDGTVYAWGYNNRGCLGVDSGTTTYYGTATQIPGLEDIADIAAGNSVWYLDKDGTVFTFDGGIRREIAHDAVNIELDHQNSENSVVIYFEDEISLDGSYNYNWPIEGDLMIAGSRARMYVEDGKVWAAGYQSNNTYGQFGLGDAEASFTEYRPVAKVNNVSAIFSFECNTFFQTSDGRFYSTGRNDYHQLGTPTQGHSAVPTRMCFGLTITEEAPIMEGSNLKESVLEDTDVVIDFDQGLVPGAALAQVTLKDEEGNIVSSRKIIRLDQLILQPMAPLTPGERYTVTVPAYALTNMFGVGNASISIDFMVSDLLEYPDVSADTQEEHEVQVDPEAPDRPELDGAWTQGRWEEFRWEGINPLFHRNSVLNRLVDDDTAKWLRINTDTTSGYYGISLKDNYWGTQSAFLIGKQITDYDDFTTLIDLNTDEILTRAPEDTWPFAVRTGLIDKNGEEVDVIGNETVTFFVEFNRDMDESIPLRVRFGSYFPYADYEVEGEYVSSRRWEGTTTLTTIIENGYQFWSIENGRAEDEPYKELFRDWGRFTFEIDTSHALAMNLQGNPTDEGVELSWNQDDFDTLAGYNLYRADEDEDAYYQKLNGSIIPVGSEEFFDDTVEPGKVYYYKFTVVKTDLSESEPSGKIMIMSKDTMSPIMYHTPVYQAYEGSNVVISATVTDNLTLQSVKLHYQVGDGTWQQVAMNNMNDKYSAVISGDKVTLEGLKYYITASDGVTQAQKGSESEPYVITVQADPGEMALGDVNGDGRITILDALMLLRAINNKVVLDAEQFACADLNADGKLTSAEALVILKYANGELGSVQMS